MAGPQLWLLSCWLALSFLGFCLGIFAAWIGARLLRTGESLSDILKLTGESMAAVIKRTAVNTTIPMISGTLIFGGICWTHGYYYRGDKENRVRYTYTEVMIVARHNAHNFTLQPARMRPWETDELCDPEDWQPKQKLISMTYSVRRLADGQACKDVERGGEWYRYMKDGKPIIFEQETIADGRH